MEAEETALLRTRGWGAEPPEAGFALRLACCCRLLGSAECILPTAGELFSPTQNAARALPAYDGDAPGSLGVAVDIGATTITLELFRFPESTPLVSLSEMNRQNIFGADVLNRIGAVATQGLAPPVCCLREQLSAMLAAALSRAGAAAAEVTRAVVTGNTTMLHFFANLDPTGMGAVPFTPQSLFGEVFPAQALFPGLPADAELYLPPCVSAFIGADITCGALAVDLCGAENTLLTDVGTNGEMMLRTADGSLLCCSVAAGPAFEGAEISMGMPALGGAIDRVWAEDGQLRWRVLEKQETIGKKQDAVGASEILSHAKGICGTGLVSALRFFLECGALDETGYIVDDEDSPYLCLHADGSALSVGASGVTITQQDIRKLQLVKAAVAAGIETLLHESRLASTQLRTLWLGGGFGSCLRPEDAAAIGMIPLAAVPVSSPAGNTALRGAEMLCFARALRADALRIARGATEIPLATHPVFQEMFIEKMMFQANG